MRSTDRASLCAELFRPEGAQHRPQQCGILPSVWGLGKRARTHTIHNMNRLGIDRDLLDQCTDDPTTDRQFAGIQAGTHLRGEFLDPTHHQSQFFPLLFLLVQPLDAPTPIPTFAFEKYPYLSEISLSRCNRRRTSPPAVRSGGGLGRSPCPGSDSTESFPPLGSLDSTAARIPQPTAPAPATTRGHRTTPPRPDGSTRIPGLPQMRAPSAKCSASAP